MSGCDLRFDLDGDGDLSRLESGRTVRGRVVATLHGPFACEAVDVMWVAVTSSIGNGGRVEIERRELENLARRPAGTFELPLVVTVPKQPPTHHGTQFQRSYQLVAVAWVWNATKEKKIVLASARHDFLLSAPSGRPLHVEVIPQGRPELVAPRTTRMIGVATILGIAFAALALFGHMASHDEVLLGGTIVAVASLVGLVLEIREYRAKGLLGTPQIAITKAPAAGYRQAAGASHQCTAWVLPSASVRAATLRVDAYEETTTSHRDGTASGTRRATVSSATSTLSCHEPGTWRAPLQLPAGGLLRAEDYGSGNTLCFEATLTLQLESGRPVRVALPLHVGTGPPPPPVDMDALLAYAKSLEP